MALQNLLEPFRLPFGLLQMLIERRGQLPVPGRLRHLR
jgi:hypothetical protein